MSLVSTLPAETDAAEVVVPTPRKPIHVFGDSSTTTIRYTVPTGRKFVGQASGDQTASRVYLTVEGAVSEAYNSALHVGKANESYNHENIKLELMAGTKVRLYYTHLIGIESDE
tara:strand:+ start:3108 stop:3449 length:342 start_codon:yes stop_codon:yes gene_type:complete